MSGPQQVPMVVRFTEHFVAGGEDECWPWTGGTASGYGKLGEGGRGGRTLGAHVIALMIATGEDADGRLALHSCDFKLCVNANHLRWGTKADNANDAVARGQHFTPFRR